MARMLQDKGFPIDHKVGRSRHWCVSSTWSLQCYINTVYITDKEAQEKPQLKTFVFLHWFVIKLGLQTKEET